MKTTLAVGEKHIDLVCNAFTPILFKQIFRRDFMVEFSKTSDKASDLVNKAKELQALQNDLEAEIISFMEIVREKKEL